MSRTFEQAVDFTRLSAGTRFNRLAVLVTEPDNTKRMQHDPATVNTSTQQINVSSVNRGQALTVALEGDHVYAVGDDVYVTDAGNIDRFIAGRVTAAEAGSVTIEVRRRSGVGAASDWVVIVALGLLVEGGATNQSLNNEAPATQDIALSSGTHTLSFYGTGEIVLSGGATGALTGTGTERDRVTLTFTADGTAVTFTISGDPVLPQVESGSVATSVIITGASAATRAPDVVTQEEVGKWLNADGFAIAIKAQIPDGVTTNRRLFQLYAASGELRPSISMLIEPTQSRVQFQMLLSGNDTILNIPYTGDLSGEFSAVLSYDPVAGQLIGAFNGSSAAVSTPTDYPVGDLVVASIGRLGTPNNQHVNFPISNLKTLPYPLIQLEGEEITKL